MKLFFITVGKRNDPAFSDAINDFTGRINHYTPVEWKLIPPSEDVATESKNIIAALSDRDYIVLLDETGKELASKEMAGFLEKRLNESTHRLVFIIGGAYGVSDEVKNRAQYAISLSRLTFSHQLARLILAEQVYRAFSILKGEKYHHA